MKLLHRYVLRELLGPALLGLLVFTFVLMLREIFDVIDLVMGKGVSAKTVLHLFACLVPQVLALTIPMALLVASLLAFGRLSTDREIMAMRTSGVHLLWLVIPAIALGLVLSVVLGILNMGAMPRLRVQLTDLKYQLFFQGITALQPGRIYDDFASGDEELSFMFEEVGREPGDLRHVVIHSVFNDVDQEGQRLIDLVANRGQIVPDLERKGVRILLRDGSVQIVRRDRAGAEVLRLLQFDSMEQVIYPELRRLESGEYRKTPGEMSFAELGDAMERETRSERRANLRVERLRRWVFPFSALTFILIGVPFGIVTRASGKGIGLAISFLLILVYYGLLEWGSAVALTESPLTPLAMWSPNIVLSLAGLGMLWWVGSR